MRAEGTGDAKAVPGRSGARGQGWTRGPRQGRSGRRVVLLGASGRAPPYHPACFPYDQRPRPCSPEKRLPARAPRRRGRRRLSRVKEPTEQARWDPPGRRDRSARNRRDRLPGSRQERDGGGSHRASPEPRAAAARAGPGRSDPQLAGGALVGAPRAAGGKHATSHANARHAARWRLQGKSKSHF